jgi:hypothetical protein
MVKQTMKTRRSVMGGMIVVVVAVLGVITGMLLYTPTTTVRIYNNLQYQVTLSGCASDPATLNPGQIVDIDPNANDANAACGVYLGTTGEFLGCLRIPTTHYHDGATAKLSEYTTGGRATQCVR